jgi:N utilization substance protein B
MLNRRLLRVKVLQALYAYFQSSNTELVKAEKELFLSIDRIYDLYLYLLLLPIELAHYAKLRLDESKGKNFPSKEDLEASNCFINNALIDIVGSNDTFKKLIETKKIAWSADHDLIVKLFKRMKDTSAYNDYLNSEEQNFESDKTFLLYLFKHVIFKFDLIEQSFHERSIYWSFEEFDFACHMVRNTYKNVSKDREGNARVIPPLYKDDEDDRKFVKNLFRETIANSEESDRLIADKTKNWELDRIAVIDTIMMKMAVTELMHFRSIPVKVTLNEYIEISKFFSSPKSSTFINGILDKIIPELKEKNQLVKTGRGLIE